MRGPLRDELEQQKDSRWENPRGQADLERPAFLLESLTGRMVPRTLSDSRVRSGRLAIGLMEVPLCLETARGFGGKDSDSFNSSCRMVPLPSNKGWWIARLASVRNCSGFMFVVNREASLRNFRKAGPTPPNVSTIQGTNFEPSI
jgi:hypothetical protein